MEKDMPKTPSGNTGNCSWNIDDALESLQDLDNKIREFLERKKITLKYQRDPRTGDEPETPAP